MGPIPKSVARKGEYYEDFFNCKGKLRRIPNYLEEKSIAEILEENYEVSREDATEIENILQPMFAYKPLERSTARKCLEHPWFQGDFKKEYDELLKKYEDESKSESKSKDKSKSKSE